MKHLPIIAASTFIVAMLTWLLYFAPCDVFFWNLTKDVPQRCRAELGR